ncbi:MAG: SDR family oxidoreductase [Rhodobacteraceae bacterium]|nr:SDR family oxidoreductase [Paracoccaceae bacterium]
MTRPRSFLITGALGHIGSYLIRKFAEHYPACKLTLVDNMSTQRFGSLFNLPRSASFAFFEQPVAEIDLDALLRDCDSVIHLAAITDATNSFANRDAVEQNNFSATEFVALACARAGIPLFYPSSTSVYGTQESVVDENCRESELKPQSPYAETKLREERRIQELAQTHGLRAVIARFGTIFGISPGMRFHTAINKFCWQAATGAELTVWSSAYDQKRPYLALDDAYRAIAFFIDRELWDGRVYNVVTSNHTVRDVISRISARVPDLQVKFVDVPIMNQLSYEVRNTRLDSLGFEFLGSLDRGIEDTLKLLGNLKCAR